MHALDKLEQAVVECPPHASIVRATGEAEEVLFVVRGQGELRLDGERYALEPETGATLGPGQEYEIRNDLSGPMRMVSVWVRGPARSDGPSGATVPIAPPGAPVAVGRLGVTVPEGDPGAARAVVRRLADQQAQQATTDRTYRIVADPSTGLRSATHFVGYVPTARAPEHFHTYDEVIYILDGEGMLHIGDQHTRLAAGSCITLPARTVHCLENTGLDVLRLVAVFTPAGSPADAYYPDGTPAYPGTPVLTT